MSARHRVVPAFASGPMVACLATIVVTSLHAQTSTAENAPQVPAAAYSRAEQLLTWNTSLLISGDEVVPQWLPDGNRFWYRNKTAVGAEFVIRRRWDYFVQHLMGATPPDNYEITRPPDATGGPAGAPDDDPSSGR